MASTGIQTSTFKPTAAAARNLQRNAAPPASQANATTQNNAPQDSVQLSAAATNPLGNMTTTQLEDRAFAAKDSATAGVGRMFEQIGGLPADDQKAVGQSMFYETAASTGYYQTQGEGGQMRGMTAAEIRQEASGMNAEDKADFQADVQGWASDNEVLSQRSMAMGAVNWAQNNFSEDAPAARQQQVMGIAQTGFQVWNDNGAIIDSATELNKRNPGQGSGLFEALNQPGQ